MVSVRAPVSLRVLSYGGEIPQLVAQYCFFASLGSIRFRIFHLAWSTYRAKTTFVAGWRMQRADRLICFVWVQDGGICCVISCEFDGKRAIKAKFVSQSRPASCSTYRNNFLQHTTNIFVARQIYHARWKTRKIDLKKKQCFAADGGFLCLAFCRLYTCAKQ